jgi:hypothetical protein
VSTEEFLALDAVSDLEETFGHIGTPTSLTSHRTPPPGHTLSGAPAQCSIPPKPLRRRRIRSQIPHPLQNVVQENPRRPLRKSFHSPTRPPTLRSRALNRSRGSAEGLFACPRSQKVECQDRGSVKVHANKHIRPTSSHSKASVPPSLDAVLLSLLSRSFAALETDSFVVFARSVWTCRFRERWRWPPSIEGSADLAQQLNN